jgi:hypothetical protein
MFVWCKQFKNLTLNAPLGRRVRMNQMKINKQVFCNSWKSKCVTQWFFCARILPFCEKHFVTNSLLFGIFFAKQNLNTNLWKSSQLPTIWKGAKFFLLCILNIAKFRQIYLWMIAIRKTSKNLEKINHVIKLESIFQDWYVVYKTNNNFMAISITSACISFGNSVWKVWFSWRPCYNAFN